MSNAEAPSLPAPIGPHALLRVEALPVERHPAAVYLASLGSGSRRTMRQSLGVIAGLLSGGKADIRSLAWEKLRYQHCQAIRTTLAEKYAAGTTNKMLAALRGVLKEAREELGSVLIPCIIWADGSPAEIGVPRGRVPRGGARQ